MPTCNWERKAAPQAFVTDGLSVLDVAVASGVGVLVGEGVEVGTDDCVGVLVAVGEEVGFGVFVPAGVAVGATDVEVTAGENCTETTVGVE